MEFLKLHRYDHYHNPSACLNAYLSSYASRNSSAGLNSVFHALARGAILLGDQNFIWASTALVVNRHIRQLERLHPHETRRAPPMLWADLRAIMSYMDPLIITKNLTFCMLLRACFENGLRCGDALRSKYGAVVTDPNGRVWVTLPYTKTSRTPVQYVFHHTGEVECFVALFRRYQEKCAYACKPASFLFCNLRRGRRSNILQAPRYDGDSVLTVHRVANLMRTLSLRLNLSDVLRVHSMRVGFACACMLAGIPLSEIQKLGQWKTDTYLLYVRDAVFRNYLRDGLVQNMVDFHAAHA